MNLQDVFVIGSAPWSPAPGVTEVNEILHYDGIPLLGLFCLAGETIIYWGYGDESNDPYVYAVLTVAERDQIAAEGFPSSPVGFHGHPLISERPLAIGWCKDWALVRVEAVENAGSDIFGVIEQRLQSHSA